MSFYTGLQSTALALLTSKGQDVTLRQVSTPAYDPTTGTVAPTYTDTVLKAVITNYKQSEIDGTLIQQGDKRAILPSTLTPKTGDLVVISGVSHTVIQVEIISPAGEPVIHKAQIRK